jgi:hypothetical protein
MNPVAILLLSKIDSRVNARPSQQESSETSSTRNLVKIIAGIFNLIAGRANEKGPS